MQVHKDKQGGFMLMEILVGLALMLTAISCLAMYNRAAWNGRQEADRQVAGYLMQGEMACLQSLAADGKLQPGHYDWLGESSWLESEHTQFAVYAEVTPDGNGCWHAVIHADWRGSCRPGSLQMAGEVVAHAAHGGGP